MLELRPELGGEFEKYQQEQLTKITLWFDHVGDVYALEQLDALLWYLKQFAVTYLNFNSLQADIYLFYALGKNYENIWIKVLL